jgi:hypothetical protein
MVDESPNCNKRGQIDSQNKFVANTSNIVCKKSEGCLKLYSDPNSCHLQPFNVFHRNITGLRGKTNELLSHLHPASPHILCFTEHHMNLVELQLINIDSYKLGANYCRTRYEKVGVCITN